MVLFSFVKCFASVGNHYFLPVVAYPHPDSSKADLEKLQGTASADHHQQPH